MINIIAKINSRNQLNSGNQKVLEFYHTLKGVVCFELLDAQDVNHMLKHVVFFKHLDIIII